MKETKLRSLIGFALLAGEILATPCSHAAGGAHIVDDSEVETPGVCHLETWVTRFVPGDGYYNLAPACTPVRLPRLELGTAFQHYWDEVINAPLLGPAIKINLEPEATGVGVGLGFNTGVNLRTGELGMAQILVLVTLPVDEKVRFNLNAGWSYLNDDNPNALFYGAQIETKIGWDVSLMLEVFGREPGLGGSQMGLRFRPDDGPIDFDLLVGNFFDSITTRFITIGVTVRF